MLADLSIESIEEASSTLTGKIIGAAIEVHRALGPRLLESAYEACLILRITPKTAESGISETFACVLQGCDARLWLSVGSGC